MLGPDLELHGLDLERPCDYLSMGGWPIKLHVVKRDWDYLQHVATRNIMGPNFGWMMFEDHIVTCYEK